MKYTPKTADQIALESLRPEGIYPFEVADAGEAVSKKGSDMLVLELNVFDANGVCFSVKEYIVPGTAFGDRKFRQFAAAIGKLAKYDNGTFSSEDCLGAGGWARVGIENGRKKEGSKDTFPPRNVIKQFELGAPKKADGTDLTTPKINKQPTEAQMANQTGPVDEDVPF